jgi:large subunit ribosomal protein L21
MFAVIKTGGKQYPVQVGKKIFVEKINGEIGSSIEFSGDSVLLFSDEANNVDIDCKNIKISASIVDHKKAKKIIIFKKKRRKNYRRKNGHRQNYTVLVINSIEK